MISKKDIEHLAALSRISISEDESGKMADDLKNILDYVEKLKEADVRDVEETTHSFYLKGYVRDDREMFLSEDEQQSELQELIDAIPEKEKGYVKVRSVFGE